MNHNPTSTVTATEPVDAGIVAALETRPLALLPYEPPAVPVRAVIRFPGKEREPAECGKFLLPADALQWATGYLRYFLNVPEGTTVHIGAKIFLWHNKGLRPIGNRRVLAVPAVKPVVDVTP